MKHYSLPTEKSYVNWVRRYIFFHNKRHPQEMGAWEVQSFPSYLAVDHRVSASTQNQALERSCVSLQACAEKGDRCHRCYSCQKAEMSSGGSHTGRSVKYAVPSFGVESLNSQFAL